MRCWAEQRLKAQVCWIACKFMQAYQARNSISSQSLHLRSSFLNPLLVGSLLKWLNWEREKRAATITEPQNHRGWKRPPGSPRPTSELTLTSPPLNHITNQQVQVPRALKPPLSLGERWAPALQQQSSLPAVLPPRSPAVSPPRLDVGFGGQLGPPKSHQIPKGHCCVPTLPPAWSQPSFAVTGIPLALLARADFLLLAPG